MLLLYCISLSTADNAGPQRARLPIPPTTATLPSYLWSLTAKKSPSSLHERMGDIVKLPLNNLCVIEPPSFESVRKCPENAFCFYLEIKFICVVVSKGRCLRVVLLHLKQMVLLYSVNNTNYAPYPLGLLICLYAVTELT